MRKTLSPLLFVLIASCAANSEADRPLPLTADEEAEAAIAERRSRKLDPVGEALADEDDGDFYVSNDLETYLHSLGQHPLSGLALPTEKLKELTKQLEALLKNPKLQTPYRFEARLPLARLSGAGLKELVEMARRAHDQELLMDAKASLSENVHLELAIAAIKERQFALAEYHLDRVMTSGDPAFRAAALNVRGYFSYRNGAPMMAMAYWREALVVAPDYVPARLNSALVALEFGDGRTALANLSGLPVLPVTQLARLVGLRQTEKPSQVGNLCGSLPKKIEYAPLGLTCALNLYEGLRQVKAGKAALKKVTQIPKLPGAIEQRAFKALERVAIDERLNPPPARPKKTGKKRTKRGKK